MTTTTNVPDQICFILSLLSYLRLLLLSSMFEKSSGETAVSDCWTSHRPDPIWAIVTPSTFNDDPLQLSKPLGFAKKSNNQNKCITVRCLSRYDEWFSIRLSFYSMKKQSKYLLWSKSDSLRSQHPRQQSEISTRKARQI